MAAIPGLSARDTVIGEAVALEVPLAGFGVRLGAILLDAVVQFTLLFLLVIGLGAFADGGLTDDAALAGAYVVTVFVIVFVAFPTALETLTKGRSLGKLALGLRVVRDDNGPIASRQALVRALVGFIEIWSTAGVPAVLTMLLNAQGKRLGDLAAGTIVVRDRIPLVLPPPAPMPPHLEAWASRADIASLPANLALAIRQFLLRRDSLTPQSRGALAATLLAEVRPLVSPQPPDWVHQEDVLLAVLAERARRDGGRLARDRDLRRRFFGRDD